ncbi:MAG: proline iminopeptidase-family hydrolase [Gemmatimonadetes bacterium]|nr:proline iminopeptidase-family hydrolase [Gemmatimonadota bacterium]
MKRHLALVALAATLTACGDRGGTPQAGTAGTQAAETMAPAGQEGRLAVPGGEIWYYVVGDGAGTPVILLHGGPGYSSYYLKPLEALGTDRTVVRYDQLGGGKSSDLSDTTMFTIPHFVAELDSLRSHLGYDRVDLLGHSWGTILALEYYRAHPEHVVSMVLASPALDIPAWEENARALVKTLSDSAQQAIKVAEENDDYESDAYQNAMGEFYGRYVWRHPVEADLDSTMATVNMGIYDYMQGPSEFTITGTLKSYDATSFLPQVKVPVLYTVGEFDEANPDIVRRFADLTPGSQLAVIPGAAHITTWDNPTDMVKVVRDFLHKVDGGS